MRRRHPFPARNLFDATAGFLIEPETNGRRHDNIIAYYTSVIHQLLSVFIRLNLRLSYFTPARAFAEALTPARSSFA